MTAGQRRPLRWTVLLSLGVIGSVSATILGQAAAAGPSIVNVIAGYPTAHAFALSQSVGFVPGTFVFRITSRGSAPHTFEICTNPVTTTNANHCHGVSSRLLRAGKSDSLTVRLTKPGMYEYLSTVKGQAAKGMKGLISVGLVANGTTGASASSGGTTTVCTGHCVPSVSCSGRCTTTSTTSSGKPPATEILVGNPNAGEALFVSNCGSCHTLAAAQTTGVEGPNLDEYAPGQTVIINYVENGSDAMPSFGGSLTGSQIDDVAAYVYRSTHS